jgi:mono/diheme cytochrome c family protein
MLAKLLTPALILGIGLAGADGTKTTTTTTTKKVEETAPAKPAAGAEVTTTTTTTTTTVKTEGAAKTAASKFDLADGKKAFDMNCSACHGATGKGDGAAAAALKPKPRDLSSKEYMAKRSWAELHKVIAEGGANSGFSALMPAWQGILKKPQVDNVLAYVLSLSGNSAKADSAAAAKADKPKAKAKAE